MSDRWPCSTCGADGVRDIGSRGYCGAHLVELLRSFDPAAFSIGVGLSCGRLRPDMGTTMEDLQCLRCQATFTGVAGAHCWWCRRAGEILLEHQADLVLAPPDVDRDEARYEGAMTAWARRLAVAVRAGIVSERQARSVWERVKSRAA